MRQQLESDIHSTIFLTGSAPYARLAAERCLKKWGWPLAIPVAVCGYGLLVDIRWAIAAAALMLVLFPAMMFTGYISATGSRDAARGVFPQSCVFRRDGSVTVRYHAAPAWGHEADPPAAPGERRLDTVTAVREWGRFLEVGYKGGTLLVPVDALADPSAPERLTAIFGGGPGNL